MSQSRTKVLELAVCAIAHEAGFATADEASINILTVMLTGLINEIGRSSQTMAEHNNRCEVCPSDVFPAIIEMGLNVESILKFANERDVMFRIPMPAKEAPQKQPTILQTGNKPQWHTYIPEYFPALPDAHSFVRTPTQRHPITEYETIRDKAASQKRDLERALTRYMAKANESGPEHSLFFNNAQLNKYFPLIAIRPSPLPILDALLPRDQSWDSDEEDEEEVGGDDLGAIKKKARMDETLGTSSTVGPSKTAVEI